MNCGFLNIPGSPWSLVGWNLGPVMKGEIAEAVLLLAPATKDWYRRTTGNLTATAMKAMRILY